jgi:hypothetical protein
MGRLLTPKQRAKSALEVVRHMIRRERRSTGGKQQQKTLSDGRPSEATRKTLQILERATKGVFKKAGLNINDDEDWKFLLPWLAWAIYGKNAGRPKRWTKKELRDLRTNVARLQSYNTKLTEAACCEQLTKEIHYVDMGVTKATTLRRRLQQAKKLDLTRTI